MKILRQKFASQLNIIKLSICALMKRAVSANQSECYMETNYNLNNQ